MALSRFDIFQDDSRKENRSRVVELDGVLKQCNFIGYMKLKKKIGLKKTLLFEGTFEVIKIDLYSSCVSHFSLDIFWICLICK